MPCYNAAPYIAQAMESVRSQGEEVLELIVIDDASKDESMEVVEAHYHPNLRVLRRPVNGGISQARNMGLEHARGDYYAFLDADDLWPLNTLSSMLTALTQNQLAASERNWCFGQIEHFYSPELTPKPTRSLPPIQTGYFASAMLVRKDFFTRVGFFNPELRVGEFIDWFDRARQLDPKPVLIDQVVLQRRIHRSNSSLTHQKDVRDYLRVAALAIERKRNG